MMRRFRALHPRVLVASVLAGSLVIPGSNLARAGATTVLVPAYFYPSGPGLAAWNQLADAAGSIPIEAILNPGSGPGTIQDPNYVLVVNILRRAGGRVLGYVDTSYGKRTPAAVERDIRTYLKFYGVDGFFIDQMANTPQAVAYYEAIYQFIKRRSSDFKVVGNPGTPYTLPAYLNAVDTLVVFEGSGITYGDYKPLVPSPWIANYPPSRFANIIHDVADAAGMEKVLTEAQRASAGSVFVTDEKMPNPYSRLPGYWTQEVAAIRALDLPSRPAAVIPTSGSLTLTAIGAIGASPQGAATIPIAGPGYAAIPDRRYHEEARSVWHLFRGRRAARR
jgi:hypothetical protein